MWRNGVVVFLFVILTGFAQSQWNDEIIISQNENIVNEIPDGDIENSINVEDLDFLQMPDDQFFQEEHKITPEQVLSEHKTPSNKRLRRQSQSVTSLLDSASQRCDGIVLKWNLPNVPFSLLYHSENPEFKYYNIYRETSYFSSVSGLTPIASGEHFEELRHPNTRKWTDKFPPSGTPLYYAVTFVNYQGKQAQNVEPRQVIFYGAFEKSTNPQAPVPILPSLLKGNVLHHSLAYNPFGNEYMVAFDLDVNSDNSPDQVYVARINPLGQIVDKKFWNATFHDANMQGFPSVAFNPTTKQYLIAYQLRIATHFRGKTFILGIFCLATKTVQHGPISVLLKLSIGDRYVSSIQPKLIYNSGSGGFALSVLLEDQPKAALALFVTANGVLSSAQPMFGGEVLDAKPFMDTKNQHVYFIFQVARRSITATYGSTIDGYDTTPYMIVAIKANATGSWLFLTRRESLIHLVGFTVEKNAAIDGYFNTKHGWLTVFWNNRINGKRVISSANILGMPGRFDWENTSTACGIQRDIHGAATCYLPDNNGNILLWEEGNDKLGGYVVKDDTFQPVRGKQMRPRLVYNNQSRQALVVWAEIVGGEARLFVRNINPSSKISCTPSCSSTMKCAMYNACAPKTTDRFCTDPGVPVHGDRKDPPNKNGKYKVGARIVFTCNRGFVHLGSNQRRCIRTNHWSGKRTQCIGPPAFTTVPTNTTKKLGESVLLECSVGKVRGVKIHWLRNDKKLSTHPGSRYSLLHFKEFLYFNVLVGDSGMYTCVATNIAGEIRSSMHLRVIDDRFKDCGVPKMTTRARILGGSRAEVGTIPWQVLLLKADLGGKGNSKPFCGGTLLNSKWIVTAAHCMEYNMKYIEVRLGVHNWQNSAKHEQHYRIEKVHSHPRYNPTSYDSDIALVKLNGTVVMNKYIQPICLPISTPDVASLKPGSKGKISGWGAGNTMFKVLQTAEVEIVNRTTCVNSHATKHLTLNMFCAGDAGGATDACSGDSGGPLTIKNTNSGRSELLGVISWGDGCARKNKYGLYTKVQNYLKWIDVNTM